MRVECAPTFVDQEVFVTPTVTIGEFRCTLNHPKFEDSGPIRQDCFFFPRLAVAIQHDNDRAFVANANVVTYYNAGQIYRRHAISPDGDHGDWFGLDRRTVCDVLEANGIDPASATGPFLWNRGPADPHAYLAQRAMVDALRERGETVNPADFEERVILLFERSVRSAAPVAGGLAAARYRLSTLEAVHHVEVLLSTQPNQRWLLSDLASRVDLSAFHLCRAFRSVTGRTLHQYRLHLRLRLALERMRSTARSLVEVALEAGFCSHSHFTSAFQREFGAVPSSLRDKSKNLIAAAETGH